MSDADGTTTASAAQVSSAAAHEQILQELRDPITGELIVRIVQMSDGLWVVDFEAADIHDMVPKLFPPPHEVRGRPGQPGWRWIYRVKPCWFASPPSAAAGWGRNDHNAAGRQD